jgi:hypothetical protein
MYLLCFIGIDSHDVEYTCKNAIDSISIIQKLNLVTGSKKHQQIVVSSSGYSGSFGGGISGRSNNSYHNSGY